MLEIYRPICYEMLETMHELMQTHVNMQTSFFHQPYKDGVPFLTQLDQLILELHLNISLL